MSSVYFDKELDLMLIVLGNKKVLKRSISMSNRLNDATLQQLQQYEISRTGIHWPKLDEDFSLRGFLKEEMVDSITNPEMRVG